jgi:hypothetical protein
VQRVIAIGTQRTNEKTEVDLGEGTNRDAHGWMILTTEDTKDTEIVSPRLILLPMARAW